MFEFIYHNYIPYICCRRIEYHVHIDNEVVNISAILTVSISDTVPRIKIKLRELLLFHDLVQIRSISTNTFIPF